MIDEVSLGCILQLLTFLLSFCFCRWVQFLDRVYYVDLFCRYEFFYTWWIFMIFHGFTRLNMSKFASGKPLLPCNFDHLQPGPWFSMPHVVYRIRSAESNYLMFRVEWQIISRFNGLTQVGVFMINQKIASFLLMLIVLSLFKLRAACGCACKLCLNPPKIVAEPKEGDASPCSERCKVHNLKRDPEASKVWKKDYFHPDSYGVRK